MTRPYAEVIGDPIAQSKSPAIHNFWLERLGIDAEYRACHVTTEGLADYVAERRGDPQWRGCNVTMPHKQAVMALIDAIDPQAARVGAVNTVVSVAGQGLTGFNTDVAGFLEPLGGRPFDCVSVIGAGGAARAILAALADRGTRWVSLQNRSIAKGEALLAEFGLAGCVVEPGAEVPTAELLVNTSSLGMAGFPPLPAVEAFVMDGGTVYDIVTTPLETDLIRRARARGLATIDGLAMLIGQAAAAFEKFFGQPAPRGHDAELRALLTR
ncbi:MAG TPA: shikimate dehydrogenase [Novosphingobium sp.]|nr:shikimate dehydrogenase [Novosphingobium sp.]